VGFRGLGGDKAAYKSVGFTSHCEPRLVGARPISLAKFQISKSKALNKSLQNAKNKKKSAK
jgi:hypothetical protein